MSTATDGSVGAVTRTEHRVRGGLLGVGAGDALGATVEFMAPASIARTHGIHTEIIGGGTFGWAAAHGTDDTDLTVAVARAYAEGYPLTVVAEGFIARYDSRGRDIGTTTRAALAELAARRDPRRSGDAPLNSFGRNTAAGNGSLMRCLPTGLARPRRARRAQSREISAVTHADRRCQAACETDNDLADALLHGRHTPVEAVEDLGQDPDTHPRVAAVLETAPGRRLEDLDTTGYVLATLGVAVWALLQPQPLEELLIAVVNRGGDADTTGAVAGGLLGIRDGADAIPARWRERLLYREELTLLAGSLTTLRDAAHGWTR